jgi:NTP pyrophosphatase (non-canonical NTP hydrolase)
MSQFPHHPEIDLQRYTLQHNIILWGEKAFGNVTMRNRKERLLRFFEEALELVQAGGIEVEDILTLTAHVYKRPPGLVAQELGGVGVTAYTVAEAFGLDLEDAVLTEVERVLEKPIEHFQRRNFEKIREGITDIKDIEHAHQFSSCSDPEEQAKQKCTICDKTLAELGPVTVRFQS